jgi:hypothetical protein
MEAETEELTDKINAALITRHKIVNPSPAELWSVAKAGLQKYQPTLSYKQKLKLAQAVQDFAKKHIWCIQDLQSTGECHNPWERVAVPGWHLTKEGRACIAYAKSGKPLGKPNELICPMCADPFKQSTILQPRAHEFYCKGKFVYSYWLIHYMEVHSVRPWDLDFIDAAMKWRRSIIKPVEWRATRLKIYARALDLRTELDPGVMQI